MIVGYSFASPNDILPGPIRHASSTSPRGPLRTTTALFYFLRRSYDKWRAGFIMRPLPSGSVVGQCVLHDVIFIGRGKGGAPPSPLISDGAQ